jgi:hypothetical protein
MLSQMGLEGHADAIREAGAAISKALQLQIKIPLTEGFPQARGQTHFLLDRVWHV